MKPDRSRVNKTGHLDLLPTPAVSMSRPFRGPSSFLVVGCRAARPLWPVALPKPAAGIVGHLLALEADVDGLERPARGLAEPSTKQPICATLWIAALATSHALERTRFLVETQFHSREK